MSRSNVLAPAAAASSLLVASLLASSARAAFTTPSWVRPITTAQAAAAGTTHQQWNAFDDVDLTAGIRVETPDVADVNPNGSAIVTEPGMTGAFVTGGGNLYSPSGPLDITVTVPGYGPAAGAATRFFVQVKTLGAELVRTNPLAEPTPAYDFARFTIDGTPIGSLADFTYTELSRVTIAGGFGGEIVEHAFAFTAPDAATPHAFRYGDLSSSCSQDVLSVDTSVASVVPEPGALAAACLAGVAGGLRRRIV